VLEAIKVEQKFASGMAESDNADDDFEADRERTYAMLTAQAGSGVRARWVELPDCPNNGPLPSGTIVLMPDLSNAIIATCKHYTWVQPVVDTSSTDSTGAGDSGDSSTGADTTGLDANANPEEDPNAGPIQEPEYIPPKIYDPVMHKSGDSVATGSSIPSSEHQITQHANGTVDNSMADANGPNGDWHRDATYHTKDAGTQWEALPEENLTTHFVPTDSIVSAQFGHNDVTDVVKTAYANGQRDFKAENTIFVDPKPDVRKGLTIRWIHNGETGSGVSPKGADKAISIPDGLPASVVANDGADTTAGSGDVAQP
jgi:hypothetical protein